METMEALTAAREIAGAWDWQTEVVEPEANRLDIHLRRPEDLVAVATLLRVQRLGYLAAITGLDLGVEAGELEVLYHFCTAGAVITLRLRLPRENPAISTLTEVIPSAEPFERELSEMFGITVVGLRAPDHLYLPEDWPAQTFPQRQDFDASVLTGGNGDGSEMGE